MAGVRVLELLTLAAQRLAVVESRVFGSEAMPNVSSAPPTGAPSKRAGTVGLDAGGNILIEPLAGKKVLVAGRDMLLELHRITARLNITERAMASCPCLNTTCRSVCMLFFLAYRCGEIYLFLTFPFLFSFFISFAGAVQ